VKRIAWLLLVLVLLISFISMTAECFGGGGGDDGGIVPRDEIQAREILYKIKMGQPVEYDNIIVKGNLELYGLGLPEKQMRNSIFYQNVTVVSTPISIKYSVIDGDLSMWNTLFENQVNFEGTVFNGSTQFDDSFFNGTSTFSNCKFNGTVFFMETRFNKLADFGFSNFNERSFFSDSIFFNISNFLKTKFIKTANFERSYFNKRTDFSGADFDKDVYFTGSIFNGTADFGQNFFPGINEGTDYGVTDFGVDSAGDFGGTGGGVFTQNLFSGDAHFDEAEFNGTAYFVTRQFIKAANFGGARFREGADFNGSEFKGTSDFKGSIFLKFLNLTRTTFDQLDIYWPQSTRLFCDDGPTYLALIKNFRDLEKYEVADEIYYQYRQWRQHQKSWLDATKYIDILGLITCGYGVKVGHTILSAIIIFFMFGVVYSIIGLRIGPRQAFGKVNRIQIIEESFLFSLVILFSAPGELHPLGVDTYRRFTDNIKYWPVLERLIGWGLMLLLINTLSRVMIRY
jgi:hypothetical protein